MLKVIEDQPVPLNFLRRFKEKLTDKRVDVDDVRYLWLGQGQNGEASYLARMGTAVQGAVPGKTVTYTAPNGKQVEVKIIDAKPYKAS